MKKFLIICLVLLGTILPTFATNWFEISDKFYIDTDSIEPYVDDSGQIVPNQYVYWVKYLNTYSSEWKYNEKRLNTKIWYAKFKKVIDINRKVQTTKFYATYGLNHSCLEGSETYGSWESIIPETVASYEYEIIKEYAQQGR